MLRVLSAILLSIAAAGAAGESVSLESLKDSIAACAAVANEQRRVACFDALAGTLQESPGADAVAGEENPKPPAAPVPPVPDDLGKPSDADEAEIYRANVVKCEESKVSRRTFFYFENGQVWQQSNSGRLRVDVCTGTALLEKDIFGHKLSFDAEKSTVRVRRVR